MGIYQPGRPKSYDPHKNAGSKPPNGPGEYRVLDNQKQVKYVGETCNLNRRMREHKIAGRIVEGDKFVYQKANTESSSHDRREHERQKIKQHNPSENKSKGGEGRIAKAFALIESSISVAQVIIDVAQTLNKKEK